MPHESGGLAGIDFSGLGLGGGGGVSLNPGLLGVNQGATNLGQTIPSPSLKLPGAGAPVDAGAGGKTLFGLKAGGVQVAGAGIKALGKGISTVLMMRQLAKDRKDRQKRFNSEIALSKKAMVLDYLLGNKNLANRIKALNAEISVSGRKRSGGIAQTGRREAARRTR